MTNASRRFLVLVVAGTFAAAGLRGGTSDQKTVAAATEEEPEEYKNWIELAIGGVITSGDALSSNRNTDCLAIRFTAVSRICTLKGPWVKTRSFRSMVTRSGISTITT